jgi:hypothetical protein
MTSFSVTVRGFEPLQKTFDTIGCKPSANFIAKSSRPSQSTSVERFPKVFIVFQSSFTTLPESEIYGSAKQQILPRFIMCSNQNCVLVVNGLG